jgi:hypothetical protein
VPQSP